jgi:multicomponent K+:H+ antiporter subunit E
MWLFLNESTAVGHIVFGGILAVFLPLFCQKFLLQTNEIKHPKIIIKFIFVVLYDIVMANFAVAKLVLGSMNKLKPGFVEVPVELENEFAMTLFASVITLTPGTVSVYLSDDNKMLLLHVLDLDDADALIYEVKNRYEMPLKEIFE